MICQNPTFRRSATKAHYDPILNKYTNLWETPCGKCTACKIQICKEWALRCMLELPYWEKSIFTTLTYSDENLPKDNSIHKKELEEFFDKLRDNLKPYETKIKFMASGEYGDTRDRPHYHAIIFGINIDLNNWFYQFRNGKQQICYRSENEIIEKTWTKGEVYNGYVSYNSARYVSSYVFKKYYDELAEETYKKYNLEIPFRKVSNGIGKNFWIDYGSQILKRGYISINGEKNTIPRYFLKLSESQKLRNKIHGLDLLQEKRLDMELEKFENFKTDYNNNKDAYNSMLITDYYKPNDESVIDVYKKIQNLNGINQANLISHKEKLFK